MRRQLSRALCFAAPESVVELIGCRYCAAQPRPTSSSIAQAIGDLVDSSRKKKSDDFARTVVQHRECFCRDNARVE